jgi:hypothetical protein
MGSDTRRVRYSPDPERPDECYVVPLSVALALKAGSDDEVLAILMASAAEGAKRKRLRRDGVDFDALQRAAAVEGAT